jgi:hypothetical protein
MDLTQGARHHPGPAMTHWLWCCIHCLMTGRADSEDHAVAMEGTHRAYACPVCASSCDEFALRVARRKVLERMYPDAGQAYTKGWRG